MFAFLALLTVGYFLALRYKQWRLLRHVPGPLIAGVTDYWMLKRVWKDTLCEELVDAGNKYGAT